MTGKKKKLDETKRDLRIFLKHLYIYDSDDPNSESVLGGQQNHKETLIALNKGYIWQKCCF